MGDKLGITGLTIHDDKLLGFYRATVVDNDDPLQQGRIKAEVIPYFIGIDKDILPWAVPKNSMIEGAGNGVGIFAVPEVGSIVWVFFEMGDVYQPVYDGEASDAVHGLPSDRTTNYPTRKVLKTSSGITIYIDDTAKIFKLYTATNIYFEIDDDNQTVDLTHPGGAQVYIDASGNVKIIGTTINLNPL